MKIIGRTFQLLVYSNFPGTPGKNGTARRTSLVTSKQCCGSVPFWYGFGSSDSDPWICDPDPAIFVIDLQQKTIFSAYYLLKVHLHKVIKKSQNNKNQGFSCYFGLADRRVRSRTGTTLFKPAGVPLVSLCSTCQREKV
jgi:hypothetical protein